MATRPPRWQGELLCKGAKRSGEPCPEFEIEGLEFCFRHVPDELREEAEEVTGLRTCVLAQCGQAAKPGQLVCHDHSRQNPDPKVAPARQVRARMDNRLAAILAEHGERLLDSEPLSNPLEDMLELGGELKAFKNILRQYVAVMDMRTWRYASSRAGEQIRAELLLYERALDRLARHLYNISKLNIRAWLAQIEQDKVNALVRALDAALQEAGIPLDKQAAARKTLERHLRAV